MFSQCLTMKTLFTAEPNNIIKSSLLNNILDYSFFVIVFRYMAFNFSTGFPIPSAL